VTFSVRQLSTEDVAAYRSVRLEALRDHPEAFASAYAAARDQPDDYFAGALEKLAIFGIIAGDRSLAGIAAFDRLEGAKLQHRGSIIQVYVRPHMRGTGAALALIEAVTDHARQYVVQLHLGVADGNEAAIGLYRKAGFETYGIEPRYLYVDGRYVDEHLMVRFFDR
jgi:ribosomal protein S18 acetylase RimI-like enzyme